MISKETFCKALQMIQEQSETDAEFSRALDLVGDGHFIFGVKNKYFEALMLVLKEAMNDKYEYIDWWLHEANINPPFRFSGRKKAAECNLDGSFPAFYIYNNGKQRFFTKQSNNQHFKNATGGKP